MRTAHLELESLETRLLPEGIPLLPLPAPDIDRPSWNASAVRDSLGGIDPHPGVFVYDVAISPDGTRIATGGRDGTAAITDAGSGEVVRKLSHPGMVKGVAWSSDGMRVATTAGDKTVRVWDAGTGLMQWEQGFATNVNTIAFLPDGRIAVSVDEKGVVIVDTATRAQKVLPGWTDFAVSRDGSRIAVTERTGVHVYDSASGARLRTLSGHSRNVSALTFREDGKGIATGGLDNTIVLWDGETGEQILAFEATSVDGAATGGVESLQFAGGGTHLVSTHFGGRMVVWEVGGVKMGAKPVALRGFAISGHPDDLAISPKGATAVVIATDEGARRGSLLAFPTGIPAPQVVDLVGSGAAQFARDTFSDEGVMMDDGAFDDLAREIAAILTQERMEARGVTEGIEEEETRKNDGNLASLPAWGPPPAGAAERSLGRIQPHPGARLYHVSQSPDGKVFATSGQDGTVKLWETSTGKEIAVLRGGGKIILQSAFSPDGKRIIATGHDTLLRVWEVAGGREVATIPLGENGGSLSFSPDGGTIAVAIDYVGVRIVDATTFASRFTFERESHTPAFSPDGKYVVYARGAEVKVADVGTGNVVRAMRMPGNVSAIAWSPDGAWFVAGTGRGEVSTWEAETGRRISTVGEGRRGGISALQFSGDGGTLYIGDTTGRVEAWDAAALGSGEGAAPLWTREVSGVVCGIAEAAGGRALLLGAEDGTERSFVHLLSIEGEGGGGETEVSDASVTVSSSSHDETPQSSAADIAALRAAMETESKGLKETLNLSLYERSSFRMRESAEELLQRAFPQWFKEEEVRQITDPSLQRFARNQQSEYRTRFTRAIGAYEATVGDVLRDTVRLLTLQNSSDANATREEVLLEDALRRNNGIHGGSLLDSARLGLPFPTYEEFVAEARRLMTEEEALMRRLSADAAAAKEAQQNRDALAPLAPTTTKKGESEKNEEEGSAEETGKTTKQGTTKSSTNAGAKGKTATKENGNAQETTKKAKGTTKSADAAIVSVTTVASRSTPDTPDIFFMLKNIDFSKPLEVTAETTKAITDTVWNILMGHPNALMDLGPWSPAGCTLSPDRIYDIDIRSACDIHDREWADAAKRHPYNIVANILEKWEANEHFQENIIRMNRHSTMGILVVRFVASMYKTVVDIVAPVYAAAETAAQLKREERPITPMYRMPDVPEALMYLLRQWRVSFERITNRRDSSLNDR